jgi:hypothetical protein
LLVVNACARYVQTAAYKKLTTWGGIFC